MISIIKAHNKLLDDRLIKMQPKVKYSKLNSSITVKSNLCNNSSRFCSFICSANGQQNENDNAISEHVKLYVDQQISKNQVKENNNLTTVVAVVGIYAALAAQIWASTNRSNDQYNAVKDLINRENTELKLSIKDARIDAQKLDQRLDKVDQTLSRLDEMLRRKVILGNILNLNFPVNLF